HRPEVLVQVAGQGVSDSLVVHHPSGDQRARDAAVARGAQQHADVLDHAVGVVSYGNGIQIHDRKPLADRFELVLVEPAVAGVDRSVTHPLVLPRRAGRTRTRRARQSRTVLFAVASNAPRFVLGTSRYSPTGPRTACSRMRSAPRCTAPPT